MIKFSEEKVLLLHRLLIEATGGTDGVRDIGLLDSALESAYATFDGKEFSLPRKKRPPASAWGLFRTMPSWTATSESECMCCYHFSKSTASELRPLTKKLLKSGLPWRAAI